MKTTEFKNLPTDGLQARIAELRAEYYAKRSAVASGQDKNSASLGVLKRQIARALTVLGQKTKIVAK